MITAYAIYRPTSSEPLLFLRLDQAELRATDTGLAITALVEAPTPGMLGTPALCWAVRAADGRVSLHTDYPSASVVATALHGTIHPLIEQASAEAEHATRTRRPTRDPQGELTDGGLMRL